VNDSGLSPERTRLSWRRTVLAVTVIALLCARLAIRERATGESLLVAAAAMLVWLVGLVATFRRTRALVTSRPGAAGRVLPLYAATAIAYAVLGGILILTNLPG
jgi:hypothetical protein